MSATWALALTAAAFAAGFILRGLLTQPAPPAHCIDEDEHNVRVWNAEQERPTRAEAVARAAEHGIYVRTDVRDRVIDVTDGDAR